MNKGFEKGGRGGDESYSDSWRSNQKRAISIRDQKRIFQNSNSKPKREKEHFLEFNFKNLRQKSTAKMDKKPVRYFKIFRISCFFKTLQLESQMGPMPYLKKIFQYSDAETQKNLKLVNKAFWKEHALSKYRNNFSPAQEPRHNQLYCHGPCPNVDHFEVKTFRVLMRK